MASSDNDTLIGCGFFVGIGVVIALFMVDALAGWMGLAVFCFAMAFVSMSVRNSNGSGGVKATSGGGDEPMVSNCVPMTVANIRRKYGLPEKQFITESFFNDLMRQITSLIDFIGKLDRDKAFHKHADELRNVKLEFTSGGGTLGQLDPRTFKGKLSVLAMVDSTRNLMNAGHPVDLKSKEGFGLLLMLCRLYGMGTELTYQTIEIIRNADMVNSGEDMLRQMLNAPETEEKFLIATLLHDYDADLNKQYHILMYRYVSLIAKCDGLVSDAETAWMNEIMERANKEKAQPVVEKVADAASAIETLNSLIGLADVKNEVIKLTNLIKIQQQRQAKGLKVSLPSYHCVFTGNPGTGKTTVARIVAEIYKDLGILKKGHLVETDRSGLVAEYVGQTAVKTNKIIDSALDGVLFVDEAYSLVASNSNDYGHEAIATLLKRMEDNRDRLVVILAGYSGEMKQFIDSNPGLQSRFNRYIHFPDYDECDLMKIFELRASQFEYSLTDDARAKLHNLFADAVAHKDKNFGNGRFARNIFDKTIELQANRLSVIPDLSIEQLSQIVADDIPEE